MRFQTVFVPLFMAAAASAMDMNMPMEESSTMPADMPMEASAAATPMDMNMTMPKSQDGQCKQVRKLAQFVSFASNTTEVSAVTKGNATKTSEIEAKASQASTMLSTLQSNATLMTACEAFNAEQDEEDACTQTFVLQAFVKFAANDTAVASVTQNNATKAADIQLKASMAASKLETLTSNSTLQAACPAVLVKDECKAMSAMEKFVSLANNQTKLDMVTGGNTTKEDKIKAEAGMVQTKLDAMMANATFVSQCEALKSQKAEEQKGTAAAATTAASSSKKSGAGEVLKGGLGGVVSAILVVMVGMFML